MGKINDTGNPPVQLELFLLCFICYIGRGFTMNDPEEPTAISVETQRLFINKFIILSMEQLHYQNYYH